MTKAKTQIVAVRLTDETRAKLKAVADLTGLTITACITMLTERAYHENKQAIDAMMKGRKALRLAEDTEPLMPAEEPTE